MSELIFKAQAFSLWEGRSAYSGKHGWQHCLSVAEQRGRTRLTLEGAELKGGPGAEALASEGMKCLARLARELDQPQPKAAPMALLETGEALVGLAVDRPEAALVGSWAGGLSWQGPQGPVDLDAAPGLELGEAWNRPLLGLGYHLSRRSHIYYQHHHGGQEEPPRQDRELIERLRELEPHAQAQVLCSPWGALCLKKNSPAGAGLWVYAGQVQEELWF